MKNQIRAIVIDDEKKACQLLTAMLADHCEDVIVMAECNDLASGVKAIRKFNPDLVFLDIEMPGFSGLQILEFFNEEEMTFSIVFVTAFSDHALQAFRLSAVDYLLKPVRAEALMGAVERVKRIQEIGATGSLLNLLKENLADPLDRKIAVPLAQSLKFISLRKIVYFMGDGSYSHIINNEGEDLLVSKNLKYFEEALAGVPLFFRVHKSFLINISFITEISRSEGGKIILMDKYESSVSSDKLPELNALMDKYYS